jgi:putative ABC transport system permease protein
MTASRWFFGLLFLAGASAMVIVAGFAGPEGAIPLSVNAALAAAVGLSALSPLVVPLVGRLFGVALRASTLGGLAEANLRDGVRRSASTAAPLLVLEAAVPMVVTRTESGDDEIEVDTENALALAVSPASYQSVHRRAAEMGSLDDLQGNTIAVGPGSNGYSGLDLGATVDARIGDRTLALRIVAVMPPTMSGGEDFLLPADLVSPADTAGGPVRSLVRVSPGADISAVAERIRAAGQGEVLTVGDWIDRTATAQQDTQAGISAVVMGLGGLYAVIAVINAVVIAAAERRREFAAARVSGLTRGQVVRMALIESWALTAIGLLLGGVAALMTMVGITSALQRIPGVSVVAIPWALVAAVVVGAFTVVGPTSMWTTLSATRAAPVSLIIARE